MNTSIIDVGVNTPVNKPMAEAINRAKAFIESKPTLVDILTNGKECFLTAAQLKAAEGALNMLLHRIDAIPALNKHLNNNTKRYIAIYLLMEFLYQALSKAIDNEKLVSPDENSRLRTLKAAVAMVKQTAGAIQVVVIGNMLPNIEWILALFGDGVMKDFLSNFAPPKE